LLPLKLRVVYNTILFARERIQEMLRQVEGILHVVTKNQNAIVGGWLHFTHLPTILLTDNSIVLAEMSLQTDSKKFLPDPEEQLDASFFGPIQSFLSDHAQRHPNKAAIVTNQRFGAVNLKWRGGASKSFLFHVCYTGIIPTSMWMRRATGLRTTSSAMVSRKEVSDLNTHLFFFHCLFEPLF